MKSLERLSNERDLPIKQPGYSLVPPRLARGIGWRELRTATTMIRRILTCVVLSISLSSCSDRGMIKQDEYLKNSPQEVRSQLLGYTPLGSTRKNVESTLKTTLHREYYPTDYARSFRFFVPIEEGDSCLTSVVASHSFGGLHFLEGKRVDAYWLFNRQGILKDVQVRYSYYGPDAAAPADYRDHIPASKAK